MLLASILVRHTCVFSVKPFIFKTCSEKLTVSHCVCGRFVGWPLSHNVLDLWLGASAGALNVFLVKVLRRKF